MDFRVTRRSSSFASTIEETNHRWNQTRYTLLNRTNRRSKPGTSVLWTARTIFTRESSLFGLPACSTQTSILPISWISGYSPRACLTTCTVATRGLATSEALCISLAAFRSRRSWTARSNRRWLQAPAAQRPVRFGLPNRLARSGPPKKSTQHRSITP